MGLLVDNALRDARVEVGVRLELEDKVQNVHQQENLVSDQP